MINKKDLIQEPKIEKPEFTLKDLKFEFDLSKTNYQLDRLQNKFLEFYLRSDMRFLRAFNSNYTNDFIGFIRDKAKLREPIHLSIMGTTRGGKSYTALSLCAIHQAYYGKKFTSEFICANSMEYLQKVKEMSPEKLSNRIFLVDEQQENLMGIGSISKKLRLKDVANIIAMSNISTIQLNPVRFANTDAFYGLRLFGKCYDTKTTRSMLYNLQESAKLIPVGNLYLPIFTALLPKSYAEPLEKAYLERKKAWIELERTGQNDELAHLRRKYARDFMKDKQFLKIDKKNEQQSYIKSVMGSGFTSGEIDDIFQLTKLFRQGIKFEEDN